MLSPSWDHSASTDSLRNAVLSGNVQEVQRLLAADIDVSAKGYDGNTALHLAAQHGLRSIVNLLLSSGAKASTRDGNEMTPLAMAIGQGHISIVEDLLPYVDINGGIAPGSMAALHIAALMGQEVVARLLLAKGASVHQTDDFGWTPLYRAVGAGQISIMQLLLDRGADLLAVTTRGSTLLQVATEGKQKGSIQFLLEKGLDVNSRGSAGMTVLHRTAYTSADIEIGKLLIQHGADVSTTDEKGGTPLHCAVSYRKHEFVRFLLEQGANPNISDMNGITPLHLSLELSYDIVLVELLLDHGADANMSDKLIGRTPLHIAVMGCHTDAAKLLLQRGASVNARDALDGRTPLFDAVLGKNSSMVSMLLENDADVLATDRRGIKLLSIARVMGISEVSRLLLQSIPGTTAIVEECCAAQSTKEDDTALEESMAALNFGANHLCRACSKLNFPSLHDEKSCVDVGCNYRTDLSDTLNGRPFNRESLGLHSKPHELYNTLKQLQDSAQEGCHLCSLISFALQNSYEILSCEGRSVTSTGMIDSSYGSAMMHRIILVYHEGGKSPFRKEELEVFNGKRFALLSIANIPPRKCSDKDFCEAEWDGRLDGEKTEAGLFHLGTSKALFYARCIKSNHPVWGRKKLSEANLSPLGGYPRIQSYMPGQIVSVYAVRGTFWLAAFVNGIPAALEAHHAGHATFGWIDSADYVRLHKEPHPSCDCGKGVWEPPLLSTIGGGQTAYQAFSPLDAIPLVKHWIASCTSSHGMCKGQGATALPLRVIDVGMLGKNGQYPDLVLTEGQGRQGQYVTLSYRWGDSPYITTISNVAERKTGMPLASMPPTFQDVIQVTRRIGLRYLWIDALCIIQDSHQDWWEQSALMGQIYANSWLNISVSACSSPQVGFLVPRNQLEIRSCRHGTLFGDSVKIPKVICPSIPRHDRIQNRDVLNSRGWILQERLLSRRTVHFGPYEIYWECLSLSASEREPDRFELWSNASEFDRESQKRRKAFDIIRHGVQYLINQDYEELLDLLGPEGFTTPCHDEEHSRWVLRNLSKNPKERQVFQLPCSHYHPQNVYAPPSITVGQFVAAHHLWYCLVQDYTVRVLSKSSDKLPALSGLASVFASVFGTRSKYVAGLWSGCILDGLAWYSLARASSSDRPSISSGSQNPAIYRAPSFSWASIDGGVHFSLVRRSRLVGDQIYEAEVLGLEYSPVSDHNPFGEVGSVSLKLKAKTIPFQQLCLDLDEIPRSSDFDPTDDVPDPSDPRILCLSLRSTSGGYLGEAPTTHRQCLLLFPVDEEKSLYRRVGFCDSQVPEPPRPTIMDRVNFTSMLSNLAPKEKKKKKKEIDYSKGPYDQWENKVVTIV